MDLDLRALAVRLAAVALLAAGATACRPMAAPMPATTLSRAQALPEGSSGIMVGVGGGVGGVSWIDGAGGGAARVRVAISDGNELDLAGQVLAHGCSGCSDEPGGKRGTNLSVGGRFGARIGLDRETSLIGGVGLAGGLTGRAAGLDLGLIRDLGERFYLSGRAGGAVPTAKERYVDNDGAHVTARTTGYGIAAAGFRSSGPMGFLVELGMAAIGTSEDRGAVFYVAVGLEQIGRLW